MSAIVAVAPAVQGAAVIAAAAAGAGVLLARDPRLRAAAMLAALALSGLAVATLEGDSLDRGVATIAAAAGAGLFAVLALAALLVRRPALLGRAGGRRAAVPGAAPDRRGHRQPADPALRRDRRRLRRDRVHAGCGPAPAGPRSRWPSGSRTGGCATC